LTFSSTLGGLPTHSFSGSYFTYKGRVTGPLVSRNVFSGTKGYSVEFSAPWVPDGKRAKRMIDLGDLVAAELIAEPTAPTRKKTGAVRWCIENGVRVGDTIEALYGDRLDIKSGQWAGGEWAPIRVTGFGESALLARRKGAGEYAHFDIRRLRKAQP
jgi:hypothetical protein